MHSIQDPRDLYTYLTLEHPNTGKVINATPLSVAIMNGQYKCVDALIRYGVEVNTRFNFPLYNGSKIASTLMTPIMLACMSGHDQIVQLLLIHNADCMLTDSSDSSVLHYALSEGPNAVAVFTILHTLLEEIDLRKLVLIADKRGYTPLHNACISNHVDVIPILVSLGCNVDARTRPQKIRENILERTVHKMDIVDTEFNTTTFCDSIKLIDETHDVEEEHLKGIEPSTGNSNITESSIEMICDVSMLSTADASNSCHLPLSEKHPSIQSIISNQFEVMKTVGDDEGVHQHQSDDTDHVTKGRKSSDSVVWGITPLHIAVKRRSIAAVTSLMAENADPRVKNDSGVSPLDMAYKLNADSPILLMLNKAAADKEMLQLLKNNLPTIIRNGRKSV